MNSIPQKKKKKKKKPTLYTPFMKSKHMKSKARVPPPSTIEVLKLKISINFLYNFSCEILYEIKSHARSGQMNLVLNKVWAKMAH